jgi:DNA-binding LacI/PurR family transcriptional regulator
VVFGVQHAFHGDLVAGCTRPRLSHVDLTTIAQDATTMTELAVARAVARLDGTVVGEREQVVPPRLVVRGTTAPPSA